ncbi:MAG: hypothetical protein EBV03_06250 [Proteobacteria bacterium]|nr:hypothetical protein [Pseudomonadota bacterium]
MGDRLTFARCGSVPTPLTYLHSRHLRDIEKNVKAWLNIPADEPLRLRLTGEGNYHIQLEVENQPDVVLRICARGPSEFRPLKRMEGGLAHRGFSDVPFQFQLILKNALEPQHHTDPDAIWAESREFFYNHPALGRFSSKVLAAISGSGPHRG